MYMMLIIPKTKFKNSGIGVDLSDNIAIMSIQMRTKTILYSTFTDGVKTLLFFRYRFKKFLCQVRNEFKVFTLFLFVIGLIQKKLVFIYFIGICISSYLNDNNNQ